MASLPWLITKQISAIPASRHSSTMYEMIGRLPRGSNSFGTVLVHGRKRVPSPATGRMAWVTFIGGSVAEETCEAEAEHVEGTFALPIAPDQHFLCLLISPLV